MGLFDKAKQAKQSAADAMAQAGAMQQQAGVPMGADMPGMGGQDMAAMAAYSAKVNKLAQSGVDAKYKRSGPNDTMTCKHDVKRITIDPSLLPFQLEGLSEGKQCTVKYDPDLPSSAVLQSW